MRVFRKCKKAKDILEFGKLKQSKDGINTLCKVCNASYMQSYKKEYSGIFANRLNINKVYNFSKILRKLSNPTKFKNNKKQGSAVKDLGCSLKYLKSYIENKFKKGMSWDNHGDWHLDHIRPLVKFNLANREEFLEAINYSNLQPLWAKENMPKGGS